jgi:hypothetical protein
MGSMIDAVIPFQTTYVVADSLVAAALVGFAVFCLIRRRRA